MVRPPHLFTRRHGLRDYLIRASVSAGVIVAYVVDHWGFIAIVANLLWLWADPEAPSGGGTGNAG